MNILIAHDGSIRSERIIADLKLAGLPQRAMVKLLDVVEVSVPIIFAQERDGFPPLTHQLAELQRLTDIAYQEAAANLDRVRALLLQSFPGWEIEKKFLEGSPSTAILEEAMDSSANLIVLGSHGRSGWKKILLGSVSLRVMTGAHCSVRIVHNDFNSPSKVPVILVGIDGSDDANHAVFSLLDRCYPSETDIHLCCVIETPVAQLLDVMSLASGRLERAIESQQQLCDKKLLTEYEDVLSRKYSNVRTSVLVGSARHQLLAYANQIGASMVLVGARGVSTFEHYVLGSVSGSIAQHAGMTVEVNRR